METLETVSRAAQRRLDPSLTDPNWLVLRRRREIFAMWLARIESAQLDVLDVGGRLQPYRPLMATRVRKYFALDLRKGPLVNLVARAEQIPLRGDTFDLAVCTQVLEYVCSPAAVIDEIHRVLKPGGSLLLSVPAVFPRDADEDAWRFLPASLHSLFTNFSRCEILPEGGSVIGFFRTLNVCLSMFMKSSTLRWMYRRTLCPVLNLGAELIDRMAASENDQFAANYSVWAQK
jgi:SAM-dependent methyltransferase